jgi:HSP20 family protein
MALPSLFRWNRGRSLPARRENSPFLSLQREMNRLFEDFWHGFDIEPLGTREWGNFAPRVDVQETDTEVRVIADLPGLDEKDFEVQVEDDVLTLRGEKHEEHEDKGRGWRERSYGSFYRTIQLPSEVEADKAKAEFKKGVLTVHLPKSAKAGERGHRVPVSGA